jgi:hypothetical protein
VDSPLAPDHLAMLRMCHLHQGPMRMKALVVGALGRCVPPSSQAPQKSIEPMADYGMYADAVSVPNRLPPESARVPSRLSSAVAPASVNRTTDEPTTSRWEPTR